MLLGGLFGGNQDGCTAQTLSNIATSSALVNGQKAESELKIVTDYFIPTWNELSKLREEVAVNRATQCKDNEIVQLLFRMSEQKTASDFELNKLRTDSLFALAKAEQECCCTKLNDKIDYVSDLDRQNATWQFRLAKADTDCCCDKLNDKIDYTSRLNTQRTDAAFALADQKADCNYNRLASDIQCNYDKLDAKTNATFVLNEQKGNCAYERLSAKTDSAFIINGLNTDIKIGEATKDMLRGNVYLSPANLADPYQAGTNVIVSRHYNSVGSGCGCSGCGSTCGQNVPYGFNW